MLAYKAFVDGRPWLPDNDI